VVRNNELLAETVMPTMRICGQNIFHQRLAGCMLLRPAQWRCRCKADMCFPKPRDCNWSAETFVRQVDRLLCSGCCYLPPRPGRLLFCGLLSANVRASATCEKLGALLFTRKHAANTP
jgi:hypothetical protein